MNWDYKNPEKEKVFRLWKQYLLQEEGTDTLWSDADRQKYKGIDLLKNGAGLGGYLYKIRFDCNVLNISEAGNDYLIRSALYWDANDTANPGRINLFAIVNVRAVRSGEGYKLSNYLNYSTASWNKKSVGKINYHYPTSHAFDIGKAQKANMFLDSLQSWFGFVADTVNYFIPLNCTDGYKIIGFDYYQSEGRELNICGYYDDVNNIIYSNAYAGEYYKHELTHTINKYYPSASPFLLAGLAAYIDDAGSLGMSERQHVKIFQKYMETHPTDLNKFAEIGNIAEGTAAVYIFGAVICNALLRRGGLPLLKTALNEDAVSDEKFITYLKKTLAITDFNDFFNREFELFLDQPDVLLRTNTGRQ